MYVNIFHCMLYTIEIALIYNYAHHRLSAKHNGPCHATLEGIQLHVNEIASFSGVHCNAIFGLKCIELMGFFSVFEVSLYCNYV